MKKASNILYTIGLVLTIIGFVVGIAFIALGIIYNLNAGMIEGSDPATVAAAATTMLGTGIYMAVVELISIIFYRWAKASLKTGKVAAHIVAIIVAVLGGNIFLFLAGIFAIVGTKE